MPTSTPKATPSVLRDPHPPGKTTIFGLQALRFVAAALVVMTHALNREVVIYNPHPLPRGPWMESGVDIFFVISGFIMVYILRPDTRPAAFWLQRFTRIVPLYWLATLVGYVGGPVLPEWFFGRQDWSLAVRSMLFLPLGDSDWPHPLLSPGWTLNYEFAFYTVLALCLLVRRPPFVLAAGLILGVTVAGSLLRPVVPALGYYAANWLMIEFLFGMVVAGLVARLPLKPWQGLALALLGLVLIYFLWDMPGPYPRGVKIGLPAMLVVGGVLVSEPLWQRHGWLQALARLGDASYAIYLTHFFLVTAITTWFAKSQAVRDAVGPYGYIALMFVAGIGAGVLAHIWIERPVLAATRQLLRRGQGRPLASAAKV